MPTYINIFPKYILKTYINVCMQDIWTDISHIYKRLTNAYVYMFTYVYMCICIFTCIYVYVYMVAAPFLDCWLFTSVIFQKISEISWHLISDIYWHMIFWDLLTSVQMLVDIWFSDICWHLFKYSLTSDLLIFVQIGFSCICCCCRLISWYLLTSDFLIFIFLIFVDIWSSDASWHQIFRYLLTSEIQMFVDIWFVIWGGYD